MQTNRLARNIGSTIVFVSLVSSLAFSPQPASASDPGLERGVRAAAANGPEALRRYIWRTRMIYNYMYADFAAGLEK